MGSGWGCGEMARLQRSRRPHLNWKRTVCARDEERAAPLVAGSQSIIARPGANADGPSRGRGAAAPDRAECADEDAASAQGTFLHLRSRMCIPSAKYVLACARRPLATRMQGPPRTATIWPLVSGVSVA